MNLPSLVTVVTIVALHAGLNSVLIMSTCTPPRGEAVNGQLPPAGIAENMMENTTICSWQCSDEGVYYNINASVKVCMENRFW